MSNDENLANHKIVEKDNNYVAGIDFGGFSKITETSQ
jgi:hypothetical protein